MTMSIGTGSGFLFVALLARNNAGLVKCVWRVAIFAARRTSVKRRFAGCFVVTLVARKRRRSFCLLGMRVMARGAAFSLWIGMLRRYRGMTRCAGLRRVCPDIVGRVTRFAFPVFVASSSRD